MLGAAVLENPVVRAWIEEQRVKLTELLASFGDQLDPESRQQAEAFAYPGRPAQRRITPQETLASGAMASGRDFPMDPVARRFAARQPLDDEAAADRRRAGRDYLARRTQEMLNRQRDACIAASTLRNEKENIEQNGSARHQGDGTRLPVNHESKQRIPGGFPSPGTPGPDFETDFERQLARALSLSLAESEAKAQNHSVQEDSTLRTAMAASLQNADASTRVLVTAATTKKLATPVEVLINRIDELYALPSSVAGKGPHTEHTENDEGAKGDQVKPQPAAAEGIASLASYSHPAVASKSDATETDRPATQEASSRHSSIVDLGELRLESASSSDAEDDGILTPDSWSDLGSHAGDLSPREHL